MLGADDSDSLLETLAILSDSLAKEEISVGLAELKAGDTSSIDEVREVMVRAGRLAE